MASIFGRLSPVVIALLFGHLLTAQSLTAQDQNTEALSVEANDSATEEVPQEIASLLDDLKTTSRSERARAITGLRNVGREAQVFAAQLLDSGGATPEQSVGLMTFLVSEMNRGGRDRSSQAAVILDQLSQSKDYTIAKTARNALGADVTTSKTCRGSTICRKTLVSAGPEESYVSYTGYDWVPGRRRPKREYQRIRVWLVDGKVTIDAETSDRDFRTDMASEEFAERFPAVAQRVAHELSMHQRRTRSTAERIDASTSASHYASFTEEQLRDPGGQ